jgi:DNA polymerase theta
VYRQKGLIRMYAWQAEALEVPGVAEGRSLVYCAPTSGGKSFVAEALAILRVLNTGLAVLVVLPFVSLCEEKAAHLTRVFAPLGKRVHRHYGQRGGPLPARDLGVMVATFEKANALVSRLIQADRLHEIGCVVVDEVHMIAGACISACGRCVAYQHATDCDALLGLRCADGDRGAGLELLLTIWRYVSSCAEAPVQPGGAAATTPVLQSQLRRAEHAHLVGSPHDGRCVACARTLPFPQSSHARCLCACR